MTQQQLEKYLWGAVTALRGTMEEIEEASREAEEEFMLKLKFITD